jgi:hypothetical protein
VPRVPWLSGGSDTPALAASLLLAALALAAAGGGIAYSVTGAGAGAPAALGVPSGGGGSSGGVGRASSRVAQRGLGLGHRGVRVGSAARGVAWGAARQVAVAALAAGSTYAIGALIGANVA